MPGIRLFHQRQHQLTLLFALVALALWGFVWVHAWSLDITQDEDYSYFLVKTHYFRAMPGSANTHWLNSFFIAIWHNLFGDEAIWLRLHSVVSFPFFAWAVFVLGKYIDGTMGRIAFYALALFNPYVLDFFSMARGYAMAMTFQAWSLVFFVRAARVPFSWRAWRWVLLFNVLTIGANLSYFYTVTAMAGYAGWLLLSSLVQRQPVARGLVKLLVIYSGLLVLTLADLLFIKYYGKDLGFGGEAHLVDSLFGSVWKGTLYRVENPGLASWLAYISLALIAGIAGWYGWQALYNKQNSIGLLLSLPLISIIALNIVFNLMLHNPYLLYRTALQWYVPGMLLICYAASAWKTGVAAVQWAGTIVAGVVAFVSIGQFVKQAHREWCYERPLQANTRQALEDLYDRHPKHPALGYSLSGIYVNYYSQLNKTYDPVPTYLPDDGATATDTALIRVLRESDYVVSAHAATLECLEKLGLRYDVLNEYPPGRSVLIRIYHEQKGSE